MVLFLVIYIQYTATSHDKMSTLLEQLPRKIQRRLLRRVTWVIDVTGSMASEIGCQRYAVRICRYFEKRGVRLDLGLISFRDLTQGEKITTTHSPAHYAKC